MVNTCNLDSLQGICMLFQVWRNSEHVLSLNAIFNADCDLQVDAIDII